MAETLINQSSDTGGGDFGFLRERQDQIIDLWLHKARSLPPEKSIGSADFLSEISTLLPLVLVVALDRAEVGEYAHESSTLRPLADRAAASGISIRSIDRAIAAFAEATLEIQAQNPAEDDAASQQLLREKFDDIRSEVSELFCNAIRTKASETEEKYLSFLKHTAEAIFVCEAREGTILEANRKAEELAGRRTDLLVGSNIGGLAVAGSDELVGACRQAFATQQTHHIENLQIARREAATAFADVRIIPLQNDAQRRLVLVAMRDTTSEIEFEERMHSFSEQLNRTATDKAEEVAALTRLTSAISAGIDTEKIIQVVVFEIGKLMTFDHLSIMLTNNDGKDYRVMVAAGKESSYFARDNRIPGGNSLAGRVGSERQAVVKNNIADEIEFEEDKILLSHGLRSYICTPLTSGKVLVGAVLLSSFHVNAFGEREIRILQDIGEQLAVAVQWTTLREQERRRKAEMTIINEVGREAMATLDLNTLLKTACDSIRRNFTSCDAGIYLLDWERRIARLAALASDERRPRRSSQHTQEDDGSGESDSPAVHARSMESSIPLDNSFASELIEKGKPRLESRPAKRSAAATSELCVPVKVAGRVDGILRIRSRTSNAFDENSVNAFTTLSDLLARAIENSRLYQRTSSLREMNENIIATMPSALLVLDQNLNVVLANSAYRTITDSDKKIVEGKNIEDLWDKQFLNESGLLAKLRESLKTTRTFQLNNIRTQKAGRQMVLNFRMSCIRAGEQPRVLLIMEDVTETIERAFSLSMLREINEAIQGTLELDKILRLVLTCVTAGNALGFNRGFLLMVNKEKNQLEGTTGIGPVNLEDARSIYSNEDLRRKSLKQLLAECDFSVRREDLPLYDLARKMVFPLADDDEIIVKTVKIKETFLVLDAENDERVSGRFLKLLGCNSFVSVPLIAKDEVVGVIVADNLYSGHPITQERVGLLSIFANHAGLAIENGESFSRLQEEIKERIEAYQRLEEMRERELRTCQLAAVGEMAARVAHEIRNPLATIGGYARAIQRSLKSDDTRYPKVEVIVDEVMRLEKILTNVVDFSRPATPNKVVLRVDALVNQVAEFVKPQLEERKIEIACSHSHGLPEIPADPGQVKQALFNIVKNAMEAIGRNGKIDITTRLQDEMAVIEISDNGPGITEDVVNNMCNLFYTTKTGGTGLGLAITRKIIEDHRGFLNVESTIGEGSRFSVYLPVRGESEEIQF